MHTGRDSINKSKEQSQKFKIVIHPQASVELIDASNFYESRQKMLGIRFLDSVERGLDTICSDPLIWKPDRLGRRKYIVWKFPYFLIYKLKNSTIYILAVAHTNRKPGYWKSRTP